LDNLATFVETHADRLSHFLEALISYRKQRRRFYLKALGFTLLTGLMAGAAAGLGLMFSGLVGGNLLLLAGTGAGVAAVVCLLGVLFASKFLASRFHRRILQKIDQLTQLETQTRRDTWQSIRDLVLTYLEKGKGRFSLQTVNKDFQNAKRLHEKGAKEIREAIGELSNLSNHTYVGAEHRASQLKQVV
jgi:hypothetical protein